MIREGARERERERETFIFSLGVMLAQLVKASVGQADVRRLVICLSESVRRGLIFSGCDKIIINMVEWIES